MVEDVSGVRFRGTRLHALGLVAGKERCRHWRRLLSRDKTPRSGSCRRKETFDVLANQLIDVVEDQLRDVIEDQIRDVVEDHFRDVVEDHIRDVVEDQNPLAAISAGCVLSYFEA